MCSDPKQMIRDPDVQEELGICVETAKVGVEVSTWKSFFLFFFLKKFFFLFFIVSLLYSF